MIKRFFLTIMILGFFTNLSANYHKLAYDFNFRGLDGDQINLKDYEDKVIISTDPYFYTLDLTSGLMLSKTSITFLFSNLM